MMERIVTIGVYGKAEQDFYRDLRAAQVDTFLDIRARRGVRGSEYAWANSRRLQEGLARAGIAYLHRPDLAPSQAVRDAQGEADAEAGIARRRRERVSGAFRIAYEREVLAGIDSGKLLEALGPQARVAALFCVEAAPEACHRSLLAEKLGRDWAVPVKHL